MIVHDCHQRSAEWFALRLGQLTSTGAADMLATVKSGEAAARRDLRLRLVCERLTGRGDNGFVTDAMQRGTAMEPVARMAYEVATGSIVHECGFVQHDTLPAGCSPDGYVGAWDTVVSLKCPKSATHLRYLRAGVMPAEYVPQMMHELWITGATYYDFVSYDDRFPVALQLFCLRVDRNDAAVEAYARTACAFLSEIATETEAVATLGNLRGQFAASVTA